MKGLAKSSLSVVTLMLLSTAFSYANSRPGKTSSFNKDWSFHLGDVAGAEAPAFDDAQWRKLNLPHDWSIEGEFSETNPSTFSGGALPGGIGWYRKTFSVPASAKDGSVWIEFDGVYRNGEVWLNGHYLGKRPYGYSSFEYELTPYLNYGASKNVIAVKVDNSQQPNSRWYSGSGIYRNVWLTMTDKVHVDHWGTYITTPEVSEQAAAVNVRTKLRNQLNSAQAVTLTTILVNAAGATVARAVSKESIPADSVVEINQDLKLDRPSLWSVDRPYLYKAVSVVEAGGKVVDNYQTPFGVRHFKFDRDTGFTLNGVHMKINGVCDHHDLGSLGAAVNTRALERQLEILKGMGVNGIRTSHNPPAPELLELADRMGFIVMDEAFDMWKIQKTKFDYHLDWDEWHKRDLEDMVLRDRNHPCVFMWSIGNEIPEQWGNNPEAGPRALELAGIVKALDKTRPITSACNNVDAKNPLITSGALDLIGTNYAHRRIGDFLKMFPGKPIIGSETVSSLATRGHYDMPSDQIRRWPTKWDEKFTGGNSDLTCSAYDNCSAPWGSTQEETLKQYKKYDFFSGQFIWTGFDYIGEPTPYEFPARSSYFGIVDLAGFPKDTYYLYKSEWTNKPVLHLFPHWNWNAGQTVDVWAYFNTEEVELFLNGKSLGTKRKAGDDLHVMWRVPFEPGVLKAVGRTGGKVILTDEVRTAGAPAKILLAADRQKINAGGEDLSFITVKVVDKDGVLVPDAANLVKFDLSGPGFIAGVDNGSETSMESFKADHRKAFNGLCLAIIQSKAAAGRITLKATSDGLTGASVVIESK